MRSTICIAEDREACEPALKLLILSLNRHSPEMAISLFYPPAGDRFLKWIAKFQQVRLQADRLTNGYGWNVKPQALMYMLNQGFEEVIWIDSDVVVMGNVRRVFDQLGPDTLVATEDALGPDRDDHNALRARLWGFRVGRVLPFGLNSGVLRVTKNHHPLVTRWWELLQSSAYQDSQKSEWKLRPVHMLGDQDVLTALVTSEEFSEIPIHILRRGKHILQFNGVYGYTVAERIRNLLGDGPVFIHSFAGKPWSARWPARDSMGLREFLKTVYLDLSPYTLSAMRFENDMECDTGWMKPHYRVSATLRALGLGRPELAGLPIAAFMDVGRTLKGMKKSKPSDPTVLAANRPTITNG